MGKATKIAKFIPLLIIVAVALYFGGKWAYTEWFASDEQKISASVERIIDAARRRHVRDMTAEATDDYSDLFHANRDALHSTLVYMWPRYKVVEVTVLEKPKITFDPDNKDSATVDFTARVLLGTTAGEKPTDDFVERKRGSNQFRFFYIKRDGKWKLKSVGLPPKNK